MKPIPPNNHLNSGLILEEPNQADHIVGGVNVAGLQIIKPDPIEVFKDGHGWHGVVTKGDGESQKNKHFDGYTCTDFARMKALCKYLKYVFNEDIDPLEAYAAVMSGTIPGRGNSVRNGLESTRKDAWLNENEAPNRIMTSETTQNQFFSPFTTKQIETARKKLEKYNIYWDLIENSSNVSHAKIIDSLKYSPVIVIGYAWASYYGNVGVYHSYNYAPNHCFIIDDYKEGDPLIDLMANDSYRFDWSVDKPDHTDLQDFVKPLSKEYKIGGAWRIYATLKTSKKKLYSLKFMNDFYYYWDYDKEKNPKGGHNIYRIGVPAGETSKYRQKVDLDDPRRDPAVWIALIENMNQSSWSEVSRYPDISSINKKFF